MNNSTKIEIALISKLQLVFILVMVMSAFQMVGQTTSEMNNNLLSTTEVSNSQEANMNFFSWFMGAKQNPNSNISKDSSNSLKKQMINNGVEPNRILIKTFLKKATTYKEVLA